MKEINEYWQMRIFDLLEGNLSDAEKQEVLKQIEKENILKNEYILMQKTYLQNDPVLFPEKPNLYRREGGALTFVFTRKYAAAAAIAILFGSLAVFWFAGNKKIVEKEGITIRDTEKKINKIPHGNLTPNANTGITNSVKTFILKSVKNENSQLPEIKNEPQGANDPDPETFAEVTNVETEDTIVIQKIAVNEPVIAEYNDSIPITDLNKTKVTHSKKKSLAYKLMNNSRRMLASLQMPNVKFKTENNPKKLFPKVKMEISTPKTEIIATLID